MCSNSDSDSAPCAPTLSAPFWAKCNAPSSRVSETGASGGLTDLGSIGVPGRLANARVGAAGGVVGDVGVWARVSSFVFSAAADGGLGADPDATKVLFDPCGCWNELDELGPDVSGKPCSTRVVVAADAGSSTSILSFSTSLVGGGASREPDATAFSPLMSGKGTTLLARLLGGESRIYGDARGEARGVLVAPKAGVPISFGS